MSDLRSRFEEIPEIEKRLVFTDSFYDEKYHSMNNSSAADFINGAWYAFQEQQKKIDVLERELKSANETILSKSNYSIEWSE